MEDNYDPSDQREVILKMMNDEDGRDMVEGMDPSTFLSMNAINEGEETPPSKREIGYYDSLQRAPRIDRV